MRSAGVKEWSLSLSFIRRGKAWIVSPKTKKPEPITWSVKTFPRGLSPIVVVSCRMEGMGRKTFGFGDSLRFRDSLRQAFAESWERLWMSVLGAHSTARDAEGWNSNGFAAGPTATKAKDNAAGELAERAIFLKAWNTRRGWNALPLRGALNRVLAAAVLRGGWNLNLYRIKEAELGDVVCGLGTRKRGGAIFDCCYAKSDRNVPGALTKVLRSLLRSSQALGKKTVAASVDDLPEAGSPASHTAFYMNPARHEAFDFLSRTQEPSTIRLGHYDKTVSELLIDIPKFPFVARSSNPKWPRLNWGRHSISEGSNPWPHPLA